MASDRDFLNADKYELSRTKPKSRRGLVLLAAVIGVAALVMALTLNDMRSEARAREEGAAATTGEEAHGIPPASLAGEADTDTAYVHPATLTAGQIIAYVDGQPLYVVDPHPMALADEGMVIEMRANDENDLPKYLLYVPANAPPRDVPTAEFHYLKAGDNLYVKVSLTPVVR